MSKRALVLIDIQNDYFPGGNWTLSGIESAASRESLGQPGDDHVRKILPDGVGEVVGGGLAFDIGTERQHDFDLVGGRLDAAQLQPLGLVEAVEIGGPLLGLGLLLELLAPLRRPQAVQPLPSAGWSPMRGPVQAAAAGGLWVAWPCGLLQSALLVASLTSGPQAGAGAMAAFALASSGGLLAAPWLWQQLKTRTGLPTWERWLVRIAGACLVLGSGFSLGHGVWPQVAAFCGWT